MSTRLPVAAAPTAGEPSWPLVRSLFYRRTDLQVAFGRVWSPLESDQAHRSRARNWMLPPEGSRGPRGQIGTGTLTPWDRLTAGLEACLDTDIGCRPQVIDLVDWQCRRFHGRFRYRQPLMGRRGPQRALAAYSREHGDVVARLADASAPDSDGGTEYTPAEAAEPLPEVREARRELEELELRLQQVAGRVA